MVVAGVATAGRAVGAGNPEVGGTSVEDDHELLLVGTKRDRAVVLES